MLVREKDKTQSKSHLAKMKLMNPAILMLWARFMYGEDGKARIEDPLTAAKVGTKADPDVLEG